MNQTHDEIVRDYIRQTIWRVPDAYYDCLMQVAAMQKQIEVGGMGEYNTSTKQGEATFSAAVSAFGAGKVVGPVYMSWEQFVAGISVAAKTARHIESMMKEILDRLRARKLSDAELNKAKQAVTFLGLLNSWISAVKTAVHKCAPDRFSVLF